MDASEIQTRAYALEMAVKHHSPNSTNASTEVVQTAEDFYKFLTQPTKTPNE